MHQIRVLFVLVPFSVVTGLAFWHQGYWGILAPHFQSWGAAQEPARGF